MERMQTPQQLMVHTPDGAYPILVDSGLLAQAGAFLSSIALSYQERGQWGEAFSSRCAIVTHPRVGKLYAPRVVESLRAHKFEPRVIEIPEGEKFKTLDTVRVLYDQLLDAGLDRRSPILALGGGVVGDIAGFAAATFLRGVPFVQLPTTLLAMVDASIGGKVGVDHARGKNLVGAFKQPLAVMVDPDALATLPQEEFRSGMAEVVKHAVIGDVGLFEMLEHSAWRLENRNWLEQAIRVKVKIVGRDPFERNERAKLNLGHTFGHAIEKLSKYKMRHGDAVAIGLVCAARLAARRRLCDASLVTRTSDLLDTLNLPTCVPRGISAAAILRAMQVDKKRIDARLRFVLPRTPGDVVIVDDVTSEEIMVAIESNRG